MLRYPIIADLNKISVDDRVVQEVVDGIIHVVVHVVIAPAVNK